MLDIKKIREDYEGVKSRVEFTLEFQRLRN